MKRFICIFILSLFAFSMIVVFNNTSGTIDLAKKEFPPNLTEEQKKHIEKINKKLEAAWSDIKTGFNINETQYFQVDLSKLHLFGKGQGFISDTNKTKSILKNVINPNLDNVPIGSIQPLILINFNGDEVLFCYKEADGTNVLRKSKLNNEDWVTEEIKQKGAALLD